VSVKIGVQAIFDVFSRRTPTAVPLRRLTKEFRARVLMLLRDTFNQPSGYAAVEGYLDDMYVDVGRKLSYLVGRHRLNTDRQFDSGVDDVFLFVQRCEDRHFLDFLEYVFQAECYWRIKVDGDPLVEEINDLFALDDLPYALTPFVREEKPDTWHGSPTMTITMVAYPRVILRDQQVTYAEAIKPALHLLADVGFSTADKEFLDALSDYRKGEYEDCVAKCGSAFESTMKLICAKQGWPYKQSGTAAPLLKTILDKSGLPSYYEQPLFMVAMLRNKESSSHGGGVQPKKVQPHIARYAVNATAAAILLLVEHTR
jgi:hypothetical protein